MSKKSQKKGLFLSIEMIVVIIVTIIIFGLIISGVIMLTNNSKIMNIAKEKDLYVSSIMKFRSVFGELPGNITAANIPGDLNTSKAITQSYEAATITKEYWHKYPVAHMQLYASDMIPKKSMTAVTTAVLFTTAFPNIEPMLGVTIPRSSFRDDIYIMFYDGNKRVYNTTTADGNNELDGGILSNKDIKDLGKLNKQRSAAKVVFFGVPSGTGTSPALKVFKSATPSSTFNTFGIDTKTAKNLSTKIDKGLPHSEDSRMIADDFTDGFYPIGAATPSSTDKKKFSCTTKTTWNAASLSAAFKDESNSTPDEMSMQNGCIISFIIE